MHQLRSCNLCRETQKIRPVFTKNTYLIAKCETCGLVYVDAVPDAEALSAIYSQSFFGLSSKFKGGESSPTIQNAKKRINRVLALSGIGCDSWLDVGCATGEFVYEAQRHVKNVLGVELSEFASKQAQVQYGVAVLNSDFIKANLESEHYDVITAWDFIEHVEDPASTLEKMHRLLKPGGALVLSTGDVDSNSAKLAGKYWHLMIPPKHLYFFSKNTIRKYLEQAGFQDVRIVYPRKYVPLDFIIWKLFSQISLNLGSGLMPFLQRLELGKVILSVNLHDIMEVQARKP